jgi:hypothetical protein
MMENKKRIAVYLDHFSANIIKYHNTAQVLKSIKSEFNHTEKLKILQKGESHLHQKEQHLQLQFYKEICNHSTGFATIILFGPTTAKSELKTIISHDNRFSDVEVSLNITDKLDLKGQLAFVNNFFYLDSK